MLRIIQQQLNVLYLCTHINLRNILESVYIIRNRLGFNDVDNNTFNNIYPDIEATQIDLKGVAF